MRTLLIPFSEDEPAQSALPQAVAIGRQFQSHIEGVYLLPSSPVFVEAGLMPGPVYTETIGKEGEIRAESAKQCFYELIDGQNTDGISTSWRQTALGIGEIGRVADLIFIARGAGWSTVCESALFECGRPVLIATPDRISAAEHIAIAWNQSTETARTVALGMPMILNSREVTVLTIEGWSVPGPGGDQLTENLSRHGVNVKQLQIKVDSQSAGEAIVEKAIGVGADLLLKGAYTQSRLRQFVFGGATRHILQHCTAIPVLMAH